MYDDSVRWARCLAEVMRTASVMCPASPRAAYTEIVSRLQASVSGCTYRAHCGIMSIHNIHIILCVSESCPLAC